MGSWDKMLDRFAHIKLTELTLDSLKEDLRLIIQTDDWREDIDSKLGEAIEQLEALSKTIQGDMEEKLDCILKN